MRNTDATEENNVHSNRLYSISPAFLTLSPLYTLNRVRPDTGTVSRLAK